jgi:hypothetical protein
MSKTRFLTGALLVGLAGSVSAQPASKRLRSEAEFLVPPQGGAFEVPVHAGEVCILSFPDQLSSKALASSPDFEVKAWGDDGVAVRANSAAAKPTTLAVATASGDVKINVTLAVVAADQPSFTLVRFKAVSAEAAIAAQVKAAVEQRVRVREAELANVRQSLERQIRDGAEDLIADRLLERTEIIALGGHERNDDHVIVHVVRGMLLGEDGYLVVEIENRSKTTYRLGDIRVQLGDREIHGPTRLTSPTADRGVIGVVPPGTTGRGIVGIRSVDQVLGKNLVVTVSGPAGAKPIRLDRGIVIR